MNRLAVCLIVFSFGCAHQETESDEPNSPQKFEFENSAALPGGEFFAPFAVIYQLGKIPTGVREPVIWGQCRVVEKDEAGKAIGEPYPCPETYIEAVPSGQSTGLRAWLETDGTFQVPFEKGRTYGVKAVCERYSIHSAEIQVIKPGKISLTIVRKKRDLR